jgi:hypothetical protein
MMANFRAELSNSPQDRCRDLASWDSRRGPEGSRRRRGPSRMIGIARDRLGHGLLDPVVKAEPGLINHGGPGTTILGVEPSPVVHARSSIQWGSSPSVGKALPTILPGDLPLVLEVSPLTLQISLQGKRRRRCRAGRRGSRPPPRGTSRGSARKLPSDRTVTVAVRTRGGRGLPDAWRSASGPSRRGSRNPPDPMTRGLSKPAVVAGIEVLRERIVGHRWNGRPAAPASALLPLTARIR